MNLQIKNIVQKLVKKYGTNNPYELANLLDIIIIQKPLGTIAGSYCYINRRKVIFLNSCLNNHDKLVVMSHELGHSILHKKENCYFMKNRTLLLTSKIERQANIFAAHLLISDDILTTYKDYSLQQISMFENIPLELLKLKFNQL